MTKKDAIASVIALEGCVVSGRTYQAYRRGKWDEARERFIEEIMGSITWLGGVFSLNLLGDKILDKLFKANGKSFDVGTDKVLRTPFNNFMKKVKPKNFTPTQVAALKGAKVVTSIALANWFIGFVVPQLNHRLTDSVHSKKKNADNNRKSQQNGNVAFKGSPMNALNSFTNIIENTNTGKLLSTDAGVITGRMYNARRKEERREIGIRDIGSIYFYMWASGHVGNLLNLAESGKATRLNPNTAQILDSHLQKYIESLNGQELSVEEFKKAVLGKNDSEVVLPKDIKYETQELSFFEKLLNKKPLEVVKLNEAEKYIQDKDVLERAREMSKLQPERLGEAVITKQQLIDSYNKAVINDPKLLSNAFSEFTGGKGKKIGEDAKGKAILSNVEYEGGKYIDEYRFVSNSELYNLKKQMKDYVETICKTSKDGKINRKLLEKVKKKNIMYSGINFAAGFAVAATFLSTLIPKFQYYVTRKTTGVDAFPGTYDYEKHHEIE